MFHKISIDTRNYYGIALDLVFHFGLSAFKLVLWLRFWNLGVPYRQVTTFFVLKKFLKLCDKNSITVWAVYGTLLGAYRSQSFAGRPSDIDFIIQVEDHDRLLVALPDFFDVRWKLLQTTPFLGRILRIKVKNPAFSHHSKIHVRILNRNHLIDLVKIEKLTENGKDRWRIDTPSSPKGKFHFEPEVLTSYRTLRIFDQPVRSFRDPEMFLIEEYGEDWFVPRPAIRMHWATRFSQWIYSCIS
jgi:hypothetical protein